MISSNICSRLFCSACDDECEVFEICKYFYNLEWNPQLICMYVMYVCIVFVCLHVAPFPKIQNSLLVALLTYVDYLMHLVHLEYLLRCRCCYYLTVKKLFDFFYFSHSYIIEAGSEWDRHTKKKGEMKNQDWLWRQHRPHTRFVKARNVTHLSLLYTEFLTLFVWEFQISRRHEPKCILFFYYYPLNLFLLIFYFKCIY